MPSDKYQPWMPDVVLAMARLGAVDVEIAAAIGISRRTFHYYKKKHPEFLEALSGGKALADARVTNALYEKACDGDTASMCFWLCNRQPDLWRHVTRVHHNDDRGEAVIDAWLEQLERRRR
jgi:hypothetical protein